MPFSLTRRFVLAGVALALSSVLFRSQAAQALVVRGDDLLAAGHSGQAAAHYRRALAIDPGLDTAADHLIFVSMESHSPAAVAAAVAIADRFLARHPENAPMLADRALCRLIQHRYGLAGRDFERSAELSHSSQEFVFAGWAAKRAGRRDAASNMWRRALSIDPASSAARSGLASVGP